MTGFINEQRRALEAVQDRGVTVIMPPLGWEHNADSGTAPLLNLSKSGSWNQLVLKPIMGVLRQYGVRYGCHIPGASAEFRLSSHSAGNEERWHVPAMSAQLVKDMLNGLAEFTSECYAAGLKDGANLLTRLAREEISVKDLENQVVREEARTKNNTSKQLKVRKY